MGEPLPLPGIFTFHSGAAGSMSGIFPSTIPEPLGPRNRGQSPPSARAIVKVRVRAAKKSGRVIGSVLAGKGRARGGRDLGIIANRRRDATGRSRRSLLVPELD